MERLPPSKALCDVFTGTVTYSKYPRIFLRPSNWDNEFVALEKELHNVDVEELKPLEESTEETLCLVMHRDADNFARGLDRGLIMKAHIDGKCCVLLIDTGCVKNTELGDIYQVPAQNETIMDFPPMCSEFRLEKIIQGQRMKTVINKFMMELNSIGCEMVDAGSPDPVPVVKLTADVGDITEKINTLLTAFSLSFQQQPVRSDLVPTSGQILANRAIATDYESSENFGMFDLATENVFLCRAGLTNSSQNARKRFRRFVLNGNKIFRVICKEVLPNTTRYLVELVHISQGQIALP